MKELLSLTVRGDVSNGVLAVAARAGSLEPQQPGTIAQLKGLRALGSAANANRSTIDSWNKRNNGGQVT